jgi:hypothetical protein
MQTELHPELHPESRPTEPRVELTIAREPEPKTSELVGHVAPPRPRGYHAKPSPLLRAMLAVALLSR